MALTGQGTLQGILGRSLCSGPKRRSPSERDGGNGGDPGAPGDGGGDSGASPRQGQPAAAAAGGSGAAGKKVPRSRANQGEARGGALSKHKTPRKGEVLACPSGFHPTAASVSSPVVDPGSPV